MAREGFNKLFLDIETTGHYPLQHIQTGETSWCLHTNHEIIDIGAVAVDPIERQMLGEFEVKIELSEFADKRMDPGTEGTTHYLARKKAGEWNNAVPLAVAMQGLLKFSAQFGKLVLGNQNFFFDWSFVNVARVVCQITEEEWDKHFHYGMFDTRSMAIQALWVPGTPFNPSEYSVRQDLLCKKLGIPPEPIPHTALNGARTAFQVWKRLTEMKMTPGAILI